MTKAVIFLASVIMAATRPNALAQITKAAGTENTPKLAVAWLDTNGDLQISYKKGQGSQTLLVEYMGFDPKGNSTGPAAGDMVLTLKDTPVERVVTLGPALSGSTWGRYANIQIDLSAVQVPTDAHFTKGLRIFEQSLQTMCWSG